jgi:hypothetical protein
LSNEAATYHSGKRRRKDDRVAPTYASKHPPRLTCSGAMPTLDWLDERTFHLDEANVPAECPP